VNNINKNRFFKFIVTICVLASLTLSVGFAVKGTSLAASHLATGGTCENPESASDCMEECTDYSTCYDCCIQHGSSLWCKTACQSWFPEAVGGVWVPVDKFGLLAPYIGLASTILVATVATAIYVKRVKHRKEKQ